MEETTGYPCYQVMSTAEEIQQRLWTGPLGLAVSKTERYMFQLPGRRKGGLSKTLCNCPGPQ